MTTTTHIIWPRRDMSRIHQDEIELVLAMWHGAANKMAVDTRRRNDAGERMTNFVNDLETLYGFVRDYMTDEGAVAPEEKVE